MSCINVISSKFTLGFTAMQIYEAIKVIKGNRWKVTIFSKYQQKICMAPVLVQFPCSASKRKPQ